MIEQHYLDDTLVQLRKLKSQADKAIAQIQRERIFVVLDPEANSIAVIMKHMAGNMCSRWTNFLTTDGENGTGIATTSSSCALRTPSRRSC